MPLPNAMPDSRYRTEEVDMTPGGSTITVNCPSDNPFEMGDDIEVVTQASGGMSGADPRQRSKRVVHAKVRSMPGRIAHLNAGFMPGMGGEEGDEVEVGLFGPVRKGPKVRKAKPARIYTAGFMPGMGEEDDFMPGMGASDPILADIQKETALLQAKTDARVQAAEANKAAASRIMWGDFAKGAAEAAKQSFEAQRAKAAASAASKTADAEARKAEAQARASGDIAKADAIRAEMEARKTKFGTTAKIATTVGVLAVVGVIGYFLLRKKA